MATQPGDELEKAKGAAKAAWDQAKARDLALAKENAAVAAKAKQEAENSKAELVKAQGAQKRAESESAAAQTSLKQKQGTPAEANAKNTANQAQNKVQATTTQAAKTSGDYVQKARNAAANQNKNNSFKP